MDAGFLSVVENGRCFVTKDIGDFTQFRAVSCREDTHSRDDKVSQPKGWIRGNVRIGFVLDIANSH